MAPGKAKTYNCSPVLLNDKKYDNWLDYFLKKFSDYANLKTETICDDNLFKTIKVISEKTNDNTEIIIDFFKANWGKEFPYHVVSYVRFINPKSIGWKRKQEELSRVGYDPDLPFEMKYVRWMDEYLSIPLELGWTEKTYYMDGNPIRSIIEWKNPSNPNGTKKDVYWFPTREVPSLVEMLLPFVFFFIKRKLVVNYIEIEPMLK